MIFLTLGTHQPFDRLVEAVDEWAAANPAAAVFGQIPEPGQDGYRPRHFEWAAHLGPHEYRRRFREAPFAVAHAGMGSIITALSVSTPLVIFPRRAALLEQRNDHQLATVERFSDKPGITAAFEAADLHEVMTRLSIRAASAAEPTISPFADARLTDALHGAIVGPRSRRRDAGVARGWSLPRLAGREASPASGR
ncbi:hypothetical protein [Acuticoccus sp.]|uniref:hypothetical protein n=1 Tax=Acuticoccus sp. TaxID=1904378 RepID=UPI003B52E79D